MARGLVPDIHLSFLNACETGATDDWSIESLLEMFERHERICVIGTRAPVSDEGSALLGCAFYEVMDRRGTIGESLLSARVLLAGKGKADGALYFSLGEEDIVLDGWTLKEKGGPLRDAVTRTFAERAPNGTDARKRSLFRRVLASLFTN